MSSYFYRGVAFKPVDRVFRLIYAVYLHKKGYFDQLEKQYNKALALDLDSAEVNCNLGLFVCGRNKLGPVVKRGYKAYELKQFLKTNINIANK